MVLHDWEQRVQPAVRTVSALHAEVLNDLDTENGGIAWWQGMSSWRHLTLVADYLLQSLSGASQSLEYAAFAADEHRRIDAAMDYRLKDYWRNGDVRAQPIPKQTDTDRKNEARRAMTVEQVLYHAVQCLDRLAPAVLIVGAINIRDVTSKHWGDLWAVYTKLDAPAQKRGPVTEAAYSPFAPVGSDGRKVQEDLLEPLADLDGYGQPDWVTWLRETRNAASHRAPGIRWHILKGTPGAPMGLHRGLPRHPKWTDIENLVHQPSDRRSLEEVVLASSTPDVLEGLVDSATRLTVALGDTMTACWAARRAQPEMLPQPGRQWRDLDPAPPLRFAGYGPPVRLLLGHGATVHVEPELGRRIQAARVFEGKDGMNAWQRER